MKQKDFKKCAICGKGVMHSGQITFYKVSITMMGIDLGAVQRQQGLEMMMGSPAIAQVMGPDEDLAKPIDKAADGIICSECAISHNTVIAAVYERISECQET
jgi:hypothetical protein